MGVGGDMHMGVIVKGLEEGGRSRHRVFVNIALA